MVVKMVLGRSGWERKRRQKKVVDEVERSALV